MTRKRKRRRRKLRLIHIVILSLFLYLSLIFNNQRKLENQLESKKNNIQLEVDKLQREIEGLNEEIENSDSLQFVEKIARDELGMVKPREIIYIDKDKKKNPFLRIRKNEK